MTPALRLQRHSPAYAAYYALNALPQLAPTFELDQNGYPIVQAAERYCRFYDPRWNSCCGLIVGGRANLLKHLEYAHGIPGQHRPEAPAHNLETLQIADAFYRDLMRNEDYEGKDDQNEIVSEADVKDGPEEEQFPVTRTSMAISLDSDTGNDDTPLQQHRVGTVETVASDAELPEQATATTKDPELMSLEDDVQFEIEEIRIKREMKAMELQEVQVRRKLAAMKKSRTA